MNRVVVTLPGISTSPEAFCGMLVEHAAHIKNIACIIEWDDESTNIAHTDMSNGDRAWLSHVFNRQFTDETGREV